MKKSHFETQRRALALVSVSLRTSTWKQRLDKDGRDWVSAVWPFQGQKISMYGHWSAECLKNLKEGQNYKGTGMLSFGKIRQYFPFWILIRYTFFFPSRDWIQGVYWIYLLFALHSVYIYGMGKEMYCKGFVNANVIMFKRVCALPMWKESTDAKRLQYILKWSNYIIQNLKIEYAIFRETTNREL